MPRVPEMISGCGRPSKAGSSSPRRTLRYFRRWPSRSRNVLTAEHWKHLRTSNVIESPFATVRLRQRVTKGAGSRMKGPLMAYKLLDMAQTRWRRLDGAHLLRLARAGIVFVDGVQQEGKASKAKARSA